MSHVRTSLKLLLSTVVFAQVSLGVAQTTSLSYSPPAHTTVLQTTSVDWDALIPQSTPAGEERAIFDNPTPTLEKFEVHATTLRPGMVSHPMHQHPWEEVILVKDGDLEATFHGQKQHAGAGAFVFFASNDPHNLKNVGSRAATYYVLNYYTDQVHTVSSKPASEQAVAGKLASSVIDCKSLPVKQTPAGSLVGVLREPTLTFPELESHITTLNPGQSTAIDIVDPGDEFLLIKTGIVEMSVNGITTRMSPGAVAYWAPNDKRTLRNVGPVPTSYEVTRVMSARSPKPAGK
jgi:quercetin dioxygenase-like cupin family protein